MINLTTITAASLKAKEVATQEYVDTGISNIVIPEGLLASEVAQAVNDNVTKIDGGKIVTSTLAANEIFTNEIVVGTTLNGVIRNEDSSMVVDFKNGSIYIA